jgi:beta-glucanase (GH16 family)
MRYSRYFMFPMLFLVLLVGCKEPDEGATAPSNLVLQTDISTDGSGNVAFTANADNAVSFDFELGNGEIKTGTNGKVNYQYTLTGTNIYPVTVTAIGSSGLTSKKTVEISVTVKSIANLFWSEEFNTEGAPDESKWSYDIGNGSGGWGNGEAQYYTNRPENVIVQGGVLKIKAISETYAGFQYTSARILTKDKFFFKYGKVDVSARMPAGIGTWPAIWMLGTDLYSTGWPACGEIDIAEHRGSELNRIFGTLHYPGHSGGNADGNSRLITNATTEFHKYSVEWTVTAIKISVDDQLVHSVANSTSIPFNHDFFLLLNVALGGTFGGVVDPAFTNAALEVDYIRVYK